MMPVEEALSKVLREAAKYQKKETVDVENALGYALAEDVYAPWSIPQFPTSIKDGYAVKAEDLQNSPATDLTLVGSVFAGSDLKSVSVGPGQAAYVTTGSILPPGSNAVVEIEQTELVGDKAVRIKLQGIREHHDVREVGSDMTKGTLLLKKGQNITAAEIGVLSMFNQTQVAVYSAPRVGVLSTGDELLAPGQAPREGFIFDSNRPMLLARTRDIMRACAPQIVNLGIIPDVNQADDWMPKLISQHGLDVLITTGAVSKGERDFIRRTINQFGQVHVERLFMKPGKPCICATVQNTLVFSLPGNPVSGMVTFDLLVAPALRTLMGYSKVRPARLRCNLASDIKLDPVRPEFHRAKLSHDGKGGFLAKSTGFQRSSALASMLETDVLLELPDARAFGAGVMRMGTEVTAVVFSDLRMHKDLALPPNDISFIKASSGPVVATALVSAGSDACKIFTNVAQGAGAVVDVLDIAVENLEAKLAMELSSEDTKHGLFVLPAQAGYLFEGALDDFLLKQSCKPVPGLSEVLRSQAPPCLGEESAWQAPNGRLVFRLSFAQKPHVLQAQISSVLNAIRASM